MRAYVINLDSATDRWQFVQQTFARVNLSLVRVTAIDGSRLNLPIDGYSEPLFQRFHGRTTNPREVACYLSHLKALEAFLETDDSHALICEDDLRLSDDFETVLAEALQYASRWNILRLSGLSSGKAAKAIRLDKGHHLAIHFGRLKGAGLYAVDRIAAKAFVSGLLPMWLPFDHAFDREWRFGLKAASVFPFPCTQNTGGFRTAIQKQSGSKLPTWRRSITTYPYQAINEVSRWLCRGSQYLSLRFASAAHSKS